MSKRRLFYAPDGPGDVIGTFRRWITKKEDEREVSVTFSGQMYTLCQNLGLEARVVAPHERREIVREDGFLIEHRPKPSLRHKGGVSFYLAEGWHALGLVWTCLRFRSNVAIVTDSSVWPVWFVARLAGIPIIAVLHCTFWPSGYRPRSAHNRMIQWANGLFFQWAVDATVGVSPECLRQVREIAPNINTPLLVGLSIFNKAAFKAIPAAPATFRPFKIMFAGRVERNKGVFDLLACAEILEKEHPGRYEWHLCGDGGALEELRSAVQAKSLDNAMVLHGRLNQDQMLAQYGQCHAVIVPTTSGFNEGFNQVAAEAILAGRPLVTSRVVPALDLLADATVEVPPDDVAAYADAVRHLADDPAFYEEKRSACERLSQPFFDQEQSWGFQLQRAVAQILDNK